MAIVFEDVIGVAQQLIEIDESFDEKFGQFEEDLTNICTALRTNPQQLIMVVWKESQRELYHYKISDESTFLNEICGCLCYEGFKATILDSEGDYWGSISYYSYD